MIAHRRFIGIVALLLCLGICSEALSQETETDVQLQYYQGLVERGVPAAIAAVMTLDTAIETPGDDQIRIVQTLVGGARRELVLRVEANSNTAPRVPIMLDDGTAILAGRVSVAGDSRGYSMRLEYLIPDDGQDLAESLGLDSGIVAILSRLLGISEARAQAGMSGVAISVSDSFSAPPQSGTSASTGLQSFAESATNALTSPTSDLVDAAVDVHDALGQSLSPTEATQTTLGKIADGAKSAAGVLKQAAGTYTTYKEFQAMDKALSAAEDCAENPTEPTAIDAKRNDPNYQRATTDRIRSARNELKLHYAIKMFASAANAVASTLLSSPGVQQGSALSKGVGVLDKAEGAMLDHVAEEYIMKDATKGVVPCKNRCDPQYTPPAPPEQLASYPPASMSCSSPTPAQLTCEATSSPANENVSRAPPRPEPPPDWSTTCGTLSYAEFTYKRGRRASQCSSVSCETSEESTRYSGAAKLAPVEDKGYDGNGPGTYTDTSETNVSTTLPLKCKTSNTTVRTEGTVGLTIRARFSIDNDDTGGLDTGGMPADTAVVEVMMESDSIPSQYRHTECGEVKQDDTSMQSVGTDCHFYGLDLYRPGFYKVYKDGDPAAGTCTLNLSR